MVKMVFPTKLIGAIIAIHVTLLIVNQSKGVDRI